MKTLTGLALSLLVFGSVSNAQTFKSDAEMNNYLTISTVTLEETVNPTASSSHYATQQPAVSSAVALGNDFLSTLGPVLAAPENPGARIAFGKKAWEVIVANKPVVNVKSASVTVLPNDRNQWMQMSNWRGPATKTFTYTAKNVYGMSVVQQTYTVAFNYGGSLTGQGAYLANATIIPSNISVAWGYTLDSNVEVGQVLNTGSVESPIPGVQLQLKHTIKTILKEQQTINTFFVKGNGSIQSVTQQ